MHMDAGGKYALRTKSIVKRIESEKNRTTVRHREPKEKQKPPPLSKYRRKTANARERNRMKEINDAFSTLQKTIPDLPGTDADKLTKITVLRLAVNYINALTGVLSDDCSFGAATDIDDVRELWCLENAHMVRAEHCVRPVMRTNNEVDSVNKNNKCINIKVPSKVEKKTSSSIKNDTKKISTGKARTTKRPSKSRSQKVCKTASISTSNGAYITLKNVAIQTHSHKPGRHSTEPLMMSMTVKRPRMDTSYLGHREAKQPRLVANSLSFSTPQVLTRHCCTPTVPGHTEPLMGATPFTPRHQPQNLPNLQDMTPLLDPDPFVNVLMPKNNRHLSDSSADSAFSSEGSAPPSPLTGITSTEPPPTLNYSPAFSLSDTVNSIDCDSVLSSPVELGNLLVDELFEDELDHLTSVFVEGDDTLNLFLEHSTANFIYTENDDC